MGSGGATCRVLEAEESREAGSALRELCKRSRGVVEVALVHVCAQIGCYKTLLLVQVLQGVYVGTERAEEVGLGIHRCDKIDLHASEGR